VAVKVGSDAADAPVGVVMAQATATVASAAVAAANLAANRELIIGIPFSMTVQPFPLAGLLGACGSDSGSRGGGPRRDHAAHPVSRSWGASLQAPS
jgi:hypothetical protein